MSVWKTHINFACAELSLKVLLEIVADDFLIFNFFCLFVTFPVYSLLLCHFLWISYLFPAVLLWLHFMDQQNWSVALTFTFNIHKDASTIHFRHGSQKLLLFTWDSLLLTFTGNTVITLSMGQISLCKQGRPKSDAAEWGIWSGFTLFAIYKAIF